MQLFSKSEDCWPGERVVRLIPNFIGTVGKSPKPRAVLPTTQDT